jgi:hypothetical protein
VSTPGALVSRAGRQLACRPLTPVSPLFPDMIQCMQIQVLEIKKSESGGSGLVRPEARALHSLWSP